MSRTEDIEMIQRELRKPDLSTQQRDTLKRQLSSIQNESSKTKSMRVALIKAHRDGKIEEVNDIRDFISRRSNY